MLKPINISIMRKIRQNVFETNSSSTHSICIAKDVELTIPTSLHFEFGEFGWEWNTLQSVSEKASYLYTGLIANGKQEDFKRIVEILEREGVAVTYQDKADDRHHDEGYVDHSDELYDFLNAVCENEGKLLRFLFSDLSFILTGNDNDDSDVDINVDYAHDEYYKGN